MAGVLIRLASSAARMSADRRFPSGLDGVTGSSFVLLVEAEVAVGVASPVGGLPSISFAVPRGRGLIGCRGIGFAGCEANEPSAMLDKVGFCDIDFGLRLTGVTVPGVSGDVADDVACFSGERFGVTDGRGV